jgi:hypothetical protein
MSFPLPSYDEIVKWRWGIATWQLRWKVVFALLLLFGGTLIVGNAVGIFPLKQQPIPSDDSLKVEGSFVGGDVIGGDKLVNVIANQVPVAQSPDVERRKIKIAIRRSIEDGWQEVERLFQETNSLREQITNQHARRGTLSSGMHLADQAERAKTFIQDCEAVLQRVDRAIEDALMEQEEDSFNTTDWLQDEKKLYEALNGFIAEKQSQVAQDGLELAKRFGDEALWTELMSK